FPDVALDALVKGISAAKEPWHGGELLAIVAEIKGDAATAVLRRELKAPELPVRVAAAKGLRTRGLDDGVRPMIVDWLKLPNGANTRLMEFLADCDHPEAIKALGKDLRKRPAIDRLRVMEVVSRR